MKTRKKPYIFYYFVTQLSTISHKYFITVSGEKYKMLTFPITITVLVLVVLLIVGMKIVVLMSVDSCTCDTNSRENSSVVLMHVHRGRSTTLLNRFDKNTTKCCHMYNRCKYASCNIAIYPIYLIHCTSLKLWI